MDAETCISTPPPGDTRSVGIIFVIRDAQIEYFNLGVRPIDRSYFTMGHAEPEQKGFKITDDCIQCGTCETNCPQGCIEAGEPYRIQPAHCLHCGNCFENCPAEAVIRID